MQQSRKPYYGESIPLRLWLCQEFSESCNPFIYAAHSALGAALALKSIYFDSVTKDDRKLRASRLATTTAILKKY